MGKKDKRNKEQKRQKRTSNIDLNVNVSIIPLSINDLNTLITSEENYVKFILIQKQKQKKAKACFTSFLHLKPSNCWKCSVS